MSSSLTMWNNPPTCSAQVVLAIRCFQLPFSDFISAVSHALSGTIVQFYCLQNHLSYSTGRSQESQKTKKGQQQEMLLSKVFSSHLHEAVFKNLACKRYVNSNSQCGELHQYLKAHLEREESKSAMNIHMWKKRRLGVNNTSRQACVRGQRGGETKPESCRPPASSGGGQVTRYCNRSLKK